MKEYRKHITRADVRAEPNKIFLFGDNLERQGFGGQAKEMRGEPNAIGIPTKKRPSMHETAFFTDDEFESNRQAIHRAWMGIFDLSFKLNTNELQVVVPSAGLGTGLAQLAQRAPRTLAYIQELIELL